MRPFLLPLGCLLLWSIIILPLWQIGLGYNVGHFRLPVPGRDYGTDVVIFYLPLFVIALLFARAFRRKRNASN